MEETSVITRAGSTGALATTPITWVRGMMYCATDGTESLVWFGTETKVGATWEATAGTDGFRRAVELEEKG